MKKKIVSLIKLVCIVYLITFIPKVISRRDYHTVFRENKVRLQLGVDNLVANKKKFSWIKKLSLALIGNKSDKQVLFPENLEKLLEHGFNVKKVLIPFYDEQKYECPAKKLTYKNNKILSYKWNLKEKKLKPHCFSDIDAFVFDVQDSGLRYDYSFGALVNAMKFAKDYKKKFIVLDRPNPLGMYMEGPGNIPIRHGMTFGEIARYVNKNMLERSVNLTVVPMSNWKRDKPITGTLESNLFTDFRYIYNYSFLKLLNEINPFIVKTSLNDPLHTILLPEGLELSRWEVDYLKKICLKLGLFCKEYSYFDSDKNQIFKGVRLKTKKFDTFSVFNAFLTVARFIKNRKRIKITYNDSFNEIFDDKNTKDFLQNVISFDLLKNKVESQLHDFYKKSKECFLYEPFPKVKKVKLIRT